MKGVLCIVGFLALSGLWSPVLAQNDLSYNPPAPQDAVATIKTVNAKSACNLQNAQPVTVEAIGNDGAPLANTALTIRLRNAIGETRLMPVSSDGVVNQAKNRLVLKTDERGQASVRFSKNVEAGRYPLVIQSSNQEFSVDAVCLGLRQDFAKSLLWLLVGLEILLILSSLFRAFIVQKSYRVLIVSDLHGSQSAYSFIADMLNKHKFDAVIVAGNLVDKTADALTYATSFVALVQDQFKLPLYLIHGDTEPLAVLKYYAKIGRSIHLNPLKLDSYTIYGLGGIDNQVPELKLPNQDQTIFVSRTPLLPQNNRPPFVQVTGHSQSAFNTTKQGRTVSIDCPPATYGQAVILHLPKRSVTSLQAPTTSVAQVGGLAWR